MKGDDPTKFLYKYVNPFLSSIKIKSEPTVVVGDNQVTQLTFLKENVVYLVTILYIPAYFTTVIPQQTEIIRCLYRPTMLSRDGIP